MIVSSAILADAATVERGKLYIHGGGWDRVGVSEFPAIQPSLSLVLTFRTDGSETEPIPVAVELVDEDGEVVGRLEGSIEPTPGRPLTIPRVLTFNGVRIARPAAYRFRVVSDDREMAAVPFEIFDAAPARADS